MSAKIHGIRKVANEIKHIPSGYHLEIWACKRGRDYEVWTSALLTPGCWTVYRSNPEYVKLNSAISDYSDNVECLEDRVPSISECIRAVIRGACE